MPRKPLVLLIQFALSLPIALSQAAPAVVSPTAAAKPTDYSGESYIIEKYATDISYNTDGTGEVQITVAVKIQSDAAVRQFGVLEFPYESHNAHLDFVYVRVHKADGSVVSTPDTDAQDQPAEVTRQAPFYSDIRNKQLPVKALSVGDRLEYQVREVRTVAAAPGHFWFAQNFVKNCVVLEETVSLTVPKQKYVQVTSPSLKPQVTETGEVKVYRWKSTQLETTKVPDEKTKKPVLVEEPPSIAVTTFRSWQEVGEWYRDLQKDRVAVTPSIQAKANDLTKGISGDEEKIAAIYTYVATQFRYIGVAFGIGRYQPHSADDVMQNQYGDCKDKHTLLATLLKAAGYDAWPVLVGSQHVLQPDVPSPGQFDHVITAVTLNHSVLWMDATTEVAPFRLLFSGLRDKEVLGIPNGSTPVIMKTPANPPFDSFVKYEAKGTLSPDGTLHAHFDVSARGDEELLYRIGFHQTARAQWPALAQNVSYSSGFAGTVSAVDASSPERLAEPFHYSYDYDRKEYADWSNRRILALMPLIGFAYGAEDAKPADTILLGGPTTYTFKSSIQLPASYTAELPPPAKIQTDFADYTATYSQANGALLIDRSFAMKQREIPVARWDEYIKFEKAVQNEAGSYIQLIGSGAKSAANLAPSNPDAVQLIQQAFADIQGRSYEAAKRELDQAAKLSPSERALWAGYGYLDFAENRFDDGFSAYAKEIEYHPENLGVYYSLAAMQEYHKKPEEAEKTLRALLQASPDDVTGHQMLATLLVRRKRYSEAIPVVEEAVKLSPDNNSLKIMLGNAELAGAEKEKGAAILKGVLTSSTDAEMLNDAAYGLADAGRELPLAHASCEKALTQLDELTAKASLASLSNEDLKHVNLLGATWDTMAWILYQEGDFHKALDYEKASWMLNQGPVVGTHLGAIYQKLGKKPEAIESYRLAIASATSVDTSGADDARQALKSLAATEVSAPEKGSLGEKLGHLRSASLNPSPRPKGSADFFILFAPGSGVEDIQFLSGDAELKSLAGQLKLAKFDVPFPPGSSAKIVRRGILYCSDAMKSCQFTMLLPGSTRLN